MNAPAIRLTVMAFACAILLAGANLLTSERIDDERMAFEHAQLLAVVNQPQLNVEPLPDSSYRLTENGQLKGTLRKITTSKGYNGRIELLLATAVDGSILGVRVTHHQETPGLGDKIELAVADWILGFNGRSLEDTRWDVKRFGGDFDQFSGATITPRAVIQAVELALREHGLPEQSQKEQEGSQ